MNVEFDASRMKSPYCFIAGWLVGRLKELEKHGLGVLVDGQPATFEEPSERMKELERLAQQQRVD